MDLKPNIILIHWHDLGRYLNCYGHQDVLSPSLDRFAAEGVVFENHFGTAPLCTPSRGSLFTGRYPHSNGLQGLAHLGWSYNSGEKTLTDYLNEAGYQTTLIGVQHESADTSTLGFDEVVEPEACSWGFNLLPYVEEFFGRAHEDPFFVSIGFYDVHREGRRAYPPELFPPVELDSVEIPGYLEDSPGAREDFAGLVSCIEQADRSFGRVMDQIRQSGYDRNSWIIFTTDHGIAFPRAKGTLYDPGTETAMMMQFPAAFDGGQRIASLTSHVDVLPTVMDALGIPASDCIQGRSFWPILKGEQESVRSAIFTEKMYHGHYDPIRAVRTDRYKLIHNFEPSPALCMSADVLWSPTARDMNRDYLELRAEYELYDLQTDPFEKNNLIDDPNLMDIAGQLKEQLEQWMQATKDPLLHGPVPAPDKQRAHMVDVQQFEKEMTLK
jgi:arylsulfatase A-like enzyme